MIGLLVSMLIVAVLFKFYSDNEKKLSDRVFFGLSSINYFYLAEKNINEFAQIVTEITAKELGEQCGGVGCYSWSANSPTYQDLRNKFEETLRGKITGFPAEIGNGGKISFAPPKVTGLEMDESHVKIQIEPQQVYKKTDSFFVNASSKNDLETEKQTRYLLLARIGQKLYGNGSYVRDWNKVYVNSGKFDCNGDGDSSDTGETISAKTKLSGANLNGCKILDINFDVDDLDGGGKSKWNSYKTNCYGIANSTDAGINAGKVENEKLYVQINSMLEKSLICGIGNTDGLASITDIKGEVSKSGSSQQTCTAEDAKSNAWQNSGIDGKISSILVALQNQVSTTYGGIAIAPAASTNMQNFETVKKTPAFGGKTACDSCREWRSPPSGQSSTGNRNCVWHNDNDDENTFCYWRSDYSCSYSGNQNSGSTSISGDYWWSGASACGNEHSTLSKTQSWGDGIFSETRQDYRRYMHYDYEDTSTSYSCYFGGYFKITFTPDISFRIIDTTGSKIVEKGTTNFENLYFAVKFKPVTPYVVGG